MGGWAGDDAAVDYAIAVRLEEEESVGSEEQRIAEGAAQYTSDMG